MNKALIALTLILLSLTVQAHTLEGNFEGLTFQGETIESTFLLCNTLNSNENFHLISNNAWMQIRPLSVYLAEDQCEEIYAFTTPHPYANSGNYEIEVIAEGNTQTVSKTFYLTVVEGHRININTIKNPINSTQCKTETFVFELKNTGIFDERALLSVQGINLNWVELSSEEILLKKNAVKEIELKVLIPCNQETKNYEFQLLTELKNTGIIKETNLLLQIENGQEISIENKSFNSCNDLKTQDLISIENNGLLEDKLTIEVSGLDWITVKNKNFTLQPGEKKEVELEFNQTQTETNNYNFSVKVYSEKFNQVYEKQFQVQLQDCYNLTLEKGAFQDSACIESKPEISFILKNNGTRKTEVKTSMTGIQAELEKNSFSLNPNDSTEIRATLNFDGLKEGNTKFVFIADSQEYTETLEGEIEIQDCFETESIVPSLELCNAVPLTDKSITIKNTGTQTQNFTISSDVEWIKLKETNFELQGKQEKQIGLIINPTENSNEKSYSIKTKTANNQYLMTGKINYLDEKTCFEITMTNLQKKVDVNSGEGAITTIKVTNNGKTPQKVEFEVRVPWVYFNPKQFEIETGETKEIYVYFNPPFDFGEEQTIITVKAETNFGFETTKDIEVNVFGGSVILTINPEDIKVSQKGLETEDTKQNIIEINIEIENNTETNMKILDVKSKFPESTYFIENPVIKKGTTGNVLLKFVASEELDLSGLEVPIEIISDKGNYYKVVVLPETKTGEGTEEETKDTEGEGTTGFVLFGEDQYVLVILIVIVVILIIMAAVRSDKDDEQEETVDYSNTTIENQIKEITKPKTKKKTAKKTKKKTKKKK